MDTTQPSRETFSAKQQAKRTEIAEAAALRLIREAPRQLLASVAPAAIAHECHVSPDTVHRLVGGREEVLEHAAGQVVTALAFRSETWPSFSDVTDRAAGAFLEGLADADANDKTQAFIDGLKVYIDANFATPAFPAETILQAALLTSSPKWEGPTLVDPEDQALADRLRKLRAEQLREATDGFGWLLAEAMSQLERRPQRGMNPATLITLMNCLVDGAVARMLMDPDCLDTETVAEALLHLGMAYTEPGSFADPHEPEDPAGQRVFAHILDAATAGWKRGDEVTIEQLAEADPALDLATIQRWFPTIGELADSVVRRKVASVKPESSEQSDALVATLESVLRRLSLTADEVPGAVVAAFAASSPPWSIATQVTEHALAVVEALDLPPLLADQLVEDACGGSQQWPRTRTLLRLLDRR